MLRLMIVIFLATTLLGCGLFAEVESTADDPVPFVAGSQPIYGAGDTSLEEKIAEHPVIVRATMSSFSSSVIEDGDRHRVIMEFGLNVSEYLKGSGSSKITAVWFTHDYHRRPTREEAEVTQASILAERDAQWDSREAIIFLQGPVGAGLLPQSANKYSLGVGYYADDRYSLHSLNSKRWLPAAASTRGASGAGSSDGSQKFLLDVPVASSEGASGASASSAAPTIALSALKTRISEVTTELNRGDGSEAYKQCIKEKYELEREIRHFKQLDGRTLQLEKPRYSTLASGQAANTELYQWQEEGRYPSRTGRGWLDGGDAALFAVVYGETTPHDNDGDGKLTAGVDGLRFTKTLTTTRPLPAGTYNTVRKAVWSVFVPCNYVLSDDWTITVTAPTGTLHEAFFDPVNLTGGEVGASGTSGVIDPDEFTVGRDEYEIESIVWDDDDEVVLTLDDHVSLSGKTLDFIELDGSIGTSLDVSDATVNQTAATWTWSLTSAPWQPGDLLMLRIRDG